MRETSDVALGFQLIGGAIVIVGSLVAWIINSAKDSNALPAGKLIPESSPLPENWEEIRYPGSSEIDRIFHENVGRLACVQSYFQVRVAGTSHRNRDKTSRAAVIKKCLTLEELELRIEADNPVDSKAIAVHRKDGGQLGYVDHVSAMRIRNDEGKPFVWNAVFKYATRHPETNRIVGAAIILVRLKNEAV